MSRLVPHALLRLLQPEDRLALGAGDPHPVADGVRLTKDSMRWSICFRAAACPVWRNFKVKTVTQWSTGQSDAFLSF